MIQLKKLSKHFTTVDGPVDALRHINLTVNDGDIYGIIGMSGAGKSTLVRCINMLERPTEGNVILDGRDLGTLSNAELRKVRRKVTMIFQSFNLLMQRTCLKNVMLPLKLIHMPPKRNNRIVPHVAFLELHPWALEYHIFLSMIPNEYSNS